LDAGYYPFVDSIAPLLPVDPNPECVIAQLRSNWGLGIFRIHESLSRSIGLWQIEFTLGDEAQKSSRARSAPVG
jgi:hypothetical protein